MLAHFEDAGFFGMMLARSGDVPGGFEITAYKGKQGPCYDTGKRAAYHGAAAAALDDDRHLVAGELAVCEKTATIYSLPGYAERVSVAGGDADLVARLESDPKAFDCDTFETDVERLAGSLGEENPTEKPTVPVMYPGPFRLLILTDGTMLRRGRPTLLGEMVVKELRSREGLLVLDPDEAEGAEEPGDFREAYKRSGSACLLGTLLVADKKLATGTPNLTALQTAPHVLKERLQKVIERGDPHFILTGSDPRDEHGCCPSDGVGAANRLVEAGVLECFRQPAPPDTCLTTIYSFAGEIAVDGKRPSFSKNDAVRSEVARVLKEGPSNPMLTVVRWVLLAFVLVTLGFAFGRGSGTSQNASLIEVLKIPNERCTVVVVFSGREHCDFCDSIKAYSRETLQRHNEEELRSGQLVFGVINTDLPEYRHFKERYELFTASLMLFELRDGMPHRWKILDEAWQLFDDETRFVEMLRTELTAFRKEAE